MFSMVPNLVSKKKTFKINFSAIVNQLNILTIEILMK